MSIIFTPSSDYVVTTDTISDVILTPLSSRNIITTPTTTVYTSPIISSPLTGPLTTSIDFTYYKPMVGVYKSMNDDSIAQQNISKFVYYRFLDKWLSDELDDIQGYFVGDGNKVRLISKLSDYKKTTFDKNTVKKIADYIEDHIFTKFDMYELLFKLNTDSGIPWVEFPHDRHEYHIRHSLRKKLIKKIEKKLHPKQSGGSHNVIDELFTEEL
jgi:hypothetical protein